MEFVGVHRNALSTGETEEEPVSGRLEEEEEEEKVYMAVAKELKKGKHTLQWVLQNFSRKAKVVIVHVHRPAQRIPIMGGKFAGQQLKEQQVAAYREHEKQKMNESLNEYLYVCRELKVRAEKLVIEMDDIGKGLLELIAQHRMTTLVMGAAADKHYSKKMEVLKSKTAICVEQYAHPSCRIWFLCKGYLICTREPVLSECGIPDSTMSSSSPKSIQSEHLGSRFSPQGPTEEVIWYAKPTKGLFRDRSSSDDFDFDSDGEEIVATSPGVLLNRTLVPWTMGGNEGVANDSWEAKSRRGTGNLQHSSCSTNEETITKMDRLLVMDSTRGERSVMAPLRDSDNNLQFLSARLEIEDDEVNAVEFDKLQEAFTEAEDLHREAYKESRRRQKAERDAVESIRRAESSELLCAAEMRKRREIETELDELKLEVETLEHQQDELSEQLRKSNLDQLALNFQVIYYNRIARNLEEKWSEALYLLHSLQEKHKDLERERDNVVRETAEILRKREQMHRFSHGVMNIRKFPYLELKEATKNFDTGLKIEGGGRMNVYKGWLHNTMVAIKILNPQETERISEFQTELDVLGRLRHPNLVTLIGACPEAFALVYEFLPNGSLGDCLACKNKTPPLTWQVRTRIATEICSALIFLHSNEPHPIIHGQLNPESILLDANYVSKVYDTGFAQLGRSYKSMACTNGKIYDHASPETILYMDPKFLSTGELTPSSDVYSFGIIMLQLLTGRSVHELVEKVQEALEKDYLHDVVDPSAGVWPFPQAKVMAELGLKCCYRNESSPPDLAEVWRALDTMMKTASAGLPSLALGYDTDDNIRVPHYFLCPIFQDIMRDPHTAADGFTYEAEALKGWFNSGHTTSPMTNLKLPHCNLVPNRALRSAIQEWLRQQC